MFSLMNYITVGGYT